MAAEDYIGDYGDGLDQARDDADWDAHELPAPTAETPFDWRRHDGDITILNTATDGRVALRIESRKFGDDDKRVLMRLDGSDRDDPHAWEAFAFVSERGLHLWKRYYDTPEAKIATLLEDTDRGKRSGLRYLYRRAS